MTYIARLELKGFKSFDKKTIIPFGRDLNCVLGPNGSGKCVTGDTEVFLADGRVVPIRFLVDEALSKHSEMMDDGYRAFGDGSRVWSLNPNTLQLEEKEVQVFVKRKAPEKLLRIRTRSGREIRATPYHPLFILKDGQVVEAKAEELTEGVRIAVPRRIKFEPASRLFMELLDLITAKDGWYVSWEFSIDQIIREKKGSRTWKQVAKSAKIFFSSLKGWLDKQAMNFAYLIQLLRSLMIGDEEIMRLIREVKAKTSAVSMKIPWKNSQGFARFLGYLLAEGRLAEDVSQVWFTNGTEELVKDYANLAIELFGLTPSIKEYKPNVWDVLLYSRPLQVLLEKLGMPIRGGTANKDITDLFLQHAGEKELAGILDGLYSGDGYVSDREVEITTKSKKLANKITLLLSRLDILSRSREVWKIATNTGFSGKYVSIHVYGSQRQAFAREIRLTHRAKQEALKHEKKSNPNVDLVEANELVKAAVQEAGISVKQLRKAFPRLDAYCYNQCLPSREGLQLLLGNVFGGGNAVEVLQRLAYSNIFWDEIEEIEAFFPEEPWVYDLCVAENHNFVANGIYVHNSNILDALCFVLGKSSAKGLRVEKSANLIYNGGKSREPASSAEVAIILDNHDKVFNDSSAEIEIKRTITKAGNSTYRINGKVHTRQQVLDLLSRSRVNPDGYNIILQGDIVHLVEMSSLERRGIVEEIAGISIYEGKKEKALRELQRVEEKLNEAEIILTERKTYLKELKKERDEAMKFRGLDEKIKRNRATLLDNKLQKKIKERDQLDIQLAQFDENIGKVQQEINALREKIAEKKKEIDEINQEVERRGEKEQLIIHKEVEKFKVDLTVNEQRAETLKGELKKLEERRQELVKSHKELKEKIDQIRKNKKLFEDKIESHEQTIKSLDKRIEEFKEKNKLEDAQDVDKKIESLDLEAEKAQEEISKLREDQQALLREKDKCELLLQSIDDKINKILAISKENKQGLEDLKKKKQLLKDASDRLSALLNTESEISSELGTAREKLFSRKEELAKLRARSAVFREGARGAVQKILELKAKWKGIHGLVSELGKVKSEYALALEIAAGNRLKSVVVDTDEVAEKCIKHLRDNKLGVATFLPLNKLNPPLIRTEDHQKGEGIHGLALDLVGFDKKYQKVFQYVFGNTLVVEDITTARRVGIGKVRMVTRSGDLVDVSGSMQGGFRHQERAGGFQEKELVEQLSRMESEVLDLEGVNERLEKDKRQAEKEIEALREQKANWEADVLKLEKTLHLDSADIGVSKEEKGKIEVSLKDIEKRLDKAVETVSEKNRVLAELKMEKQKLRDKMAELRNPRLLAELNTFEQKKNELRMEIQEFQGEMKGMDSEIQNILQPELEKSDRIMKQQDKEKSDFEKEQKDLTEKVKQQRKDLLVKEESEKKFYEQFKALFTKRTKISDEASKLEQDTGKKEFGMREVEKKKIGVSLEAARVKAELAGLEEEFRQFEGIALFKGKPEDEILFEIKQFEKMVGDLGAVNMRALEIYEGVEKEYGELLGKKEKLGKEREDVMVMINKIDSKKKDLFMKTFDVVNSNFQKIFGLLSTKGEAFIELEDKHDPFNGGLTMKVRLSGSKFMDIRGLSGGEKTMTALAFLFAVQEHDPAPFYIMDEVDAALDKRNSEKLGKLLKAYSTKAQYVVISHNDAVISESDTLYGVSMDPSAISKVTSLKV
ncbi:MAG TPA: chromosome segregation protein SMC [Candidatus Nanoarchaeia archaeon]|nr:chromosome segregation protein SMC [Candidatus Nanoarchaeia archaeon]